MLLLLAALFSPAFAVDQATVLGLLAGYEDVPSTAALAKLGDGVDTTLLAIAQDAAVPKAQRSRAVWALGGFPSATTQSFLTGLVNDPAADSQLKRSAVWALCNGWGDAGILAVEPALASDDAQLRNQAVRAVAKVGSAKATETLTARLAIEPSAMVRQTLSDVLESK